MSGAAGINGPVASAAATPDESRVSAGSQNPDLLGPRRESLHHDSLLRFSYLRRKKIIVQAAYMHLVKSAEQTHLSEVVLYIIYITALLGFIMYYDSNWLNYQQQDALQDGFFDRPLDGETYKKTFTEVNSLEDVHDWMERAFFPLLFPKPDADPHRSLLEFYMLSGAIQIRQIRVRPEVDGRTGAVGYPYWSAETNDDNQTAFPDSLNVTYRDGMDVAYTWQRDKMHRLGDYGRGGHVVLLPATDRNETLLALQALRRFGFLDPGTRYLSIGLNVYNVHLGVFTVLVFSFEWLPSGKGGHDCRFWTIPRGLFINFDGSVLPLYDPLFVFSFTLVKAVLVVYQCNLLRIWAFATERGQRHGILWPAMNVLLLGVVALATYKTYNGIEMLEQKLLLLQAAHADGKHVEMSDMMLYHMEVVEVFFLVLFFSMMKLFKYIKVGSHLYRDRGSRLPRLHRGLG
jgi:hypothetical protein